MGILFQVVKGKKLNSLKIVGRKQGRWRNEEMEEW
jgi:hypothetical protein